MTPISHWITDDFVRKSAVLHVQSFPGSHTGETVEYCKIKRGSIHIIVRDNPSNMIEATGDGGSLDFECFAHTFYRK
jgi:hypothetical protein